MKYCAAAPFERRGARHSNEARRQRFAFTGAAADGVTRTRNSPIERGARVTSLNIRSVRREKVPRRTSSARLSRHRQPAPAPLGPVQRTGPVSRLAPARHWPVADRCCPFFSVWAFQQQQKKTDFDAKGRPRIAALHPSFSRPAISGIRGGPGDSIGILASSTAMRGLIRAPFARRDADFYVYYADSPLGRARRAREAPPL